MSENILEVTNLRKVYDKFVAVDSISFNVPRAKIVGLLGPNGAGKTTTIHMLLGVTLPNGGRISYFGKDFATNREFCLQRINFTSSFNTLLGRISVWQNLLVFAQLYQVSNPEKKLMELVEYFEVQDLLKLRYWDLSAGQKTRVNLIKSLVNDPQLLLMDEPTASLDPDIADKTLSLIETLNKEKGLSILYTSHEMDEVTRICESVIFLSHGKIVAQDSPLNLTKKFFKKTQLVLTFESTKKELELYLTSQKLEFQFLGQNIVRFETTEDKLAVIITQLHSNKFHVIDIEVKKPSLEDVFLQVARGENYVPL